MMYLSCLPDPALATREDCEVVDTVMQRVAQTKEVDVLPARFKLYQVPDNMRKYRVYIETDIDLNAECDDDTNYGLCKDDRSIILDACLDEREKKAMERCLYSYGENGQQLMKEFHNTYVSKFEKMRRNWEKQEARKREERKQRRQEQMQQRKEYAEEHRAA